MFFRISARRNRWRRRKPPHSDAEKNRNEMESGPIPTQLSPTVTCKVRNHIRPIFQHAVWRGFFHRPLLLIRSSSCSSCPAIRHPPIIRKKGWVPDRSSVEASASSTTKLNAEWTSSSADRAGSTTTLSSSSSGPPLPCSVVSSSFGPPVSLTVGAMTYH